jgi:soluble P-type ATPase
MALYADVQVICLTGNHRVDDNAAERERVIASGGKLYPSAS